MRYLISGTLLLLLLTSCGRNIRTMHNAIVGHWYSEDFAEHYYFSKEQFTRVDVNGELFTSDYTVVGDNAEEKRLDILYFTNEGTLLEERGEFEFHFSSVNAYSKDLDRADVIYHPSNRDGEEVRFSMVYKNGRQTP